VTEKQPKVERRTFKHKEVMSQEQSWRNESGSWFQRRDDACRN